MPGISRVDIIALSTGADQFLFTTRAVIAGPALSGGSNAACIIPVIGLAAIAYAISDDDDDEGPASASDDLDFDPTPVPAWDM